MGRDCFLCGLCQGYITPVRRRTVLVLRSETDSGGSHVKKSCRLFKSLACICVNVLQRNNWLCKFVNKRRNNSKCVSSVPPSRHNIVHPPMSWSSQWSLSFWISRQYPICIPILPHSCYMPCPSHPPRLDHSSCTWRRVQVMKLLIM
jgi:hypothetical protein